MSNMRILRQKSKRSLYLKPNSLFYIYLTLICDLNVKLAIIVQNRNHFWQKIQNDFVLLAAKQILSMFCRGCSYLKHGV